MIPDPASGRLLRGLACALFGMCSALALVDSHGCSGAPRRAGDVTRSSMAETASVRRTT